MDPWQGDVLDGAKGEHPDGSPAATEVGVIVARQNGKGTILEVDALHTLYLTPVKLLLWSAHEFKTAKEGFLRLVSLVTNTDSLRRKVKAVRQTTGEEGIELLDGSRVKFVARSRMSGRGFTGGKIYLDEAFALTWEQMAALFPTLSAQSETAQIWYMSSAPLPESAVLRKLCKRGRQGGSKHLAYFEWSASKDAESGDVRAWLQANPAIGYRLTLEHTAKELDAMDDESFRLERLGIFSDDEDELWAKINEVQWKRLADPRAVIADPVALAVDMPPDRSWTTIAAAGGSEQYPNRRHVEIVDRRRGSDWVVDRVVELNGRHRPCVVMVDARGPAASLLPGLDAEGLKVTSKPESGSEEIVVTTSASEMAAACGAFFDDIRHGSLVMRVDPVLDAAAEAATERPLGDQWAWSRQSGVDISPLVAVTLARHGLARFAREPQSGFFAAAAR